MNMVIYCVDAVVLDCTLGNSSRKRGAQIENETSSAKSLALACSHQSDLLRARTNDHVRSLVLVMYAFVNLEWHDITGKYRYDHPSPAGLAILLNPL